MRLVKPLSTLATVLFLCCAASVLAGAVAHAYPLRVPQVPLQTGWDGVSLQSYFGTVGETVNTLTQQLDIQTWQGPPSGGATFTLKMEIAGYSGSNELGIYNAGEASPTKYQVFPGAAGPGWYATCSFSPSGGLLVNLYDNTSTFQGATNYSGVDRNNFGFYLMGPGGTFYSQDYRNGGGKPQVLTFAGTAAYSGRWWECFEDLPYASSDVDFQDAILLLESLDPTPTRATTWGSLKALYR